MIEELYKLLLQHHPEAKLHSDGPVTEISIYDPHDFGSQTPHGLEADDEEWLTIAFLPEEVKISIERTTCLARSHTIPLSCPDLMLEILVRLHAMQIIPDLTIL